MAYIDKFVSLYHMENNAQDAIGPNDGSEGFAAYTVDAAVGNYAFLGDAVDNRTNIGHDSSLDITTAISIGCMIKPNASSGYNTEGILHRANSYFFSLGWPTINQYSFSKLGCYKNPIKRHHKANS